jgi:hypothetical protein
MSNVFSRRIHQIGLMIVGGAVGIAGVVGGGQFLYKVDDSGVQTSAVTTLDAQYMVNVTATGSTTIKYNAVCIPNPLTKLSPSLGSGTVVRLTYHNITNPNGAGGDIGFVTSCANTTSGSTLIDNTCTATGCVSYYTTGTGAWNGAHFLKYTMRKDPTAAYSARITFTLEDILGE